MAQPPVHVRVATAYVGVRSCTSTAAHMLPSLKAASCPAPHKWMISCTTSQSTSNT